jgi:Carboxypeptidase regulatory-like domain/TonB dependent receptor
MRTRLILLVLALSAPGFVNMGLQAQDWAHLQGIVTDSSKAALSGATVTLTNVNTGVKTVQTANEGGLYRFDYVDGGTYTLTIEAAGFSRFAQQNFAIQARGDVTVNASLSPGALQETITVSGAPLEVQFNNADVNLTVDTKLATELPRFDRNPFKLSLLQPSARETRRTEMNPYNSWAPNSIELGGGTNLKNDLEVDGAPIGIGYKATYVPNTDSVQEANIQQNAVSAEIGHSAGGTISMSTKAGTNELHGSAFYLGRNPALNAVTDRTTNNFVAARNNIWGGNVGSPIKRNRLFNYFSFESQRPRTPGSSLYTMPTTLERNGDFSQSLNTNGGLRVIYDPWSTVFNPTTGTATRQPFPGNTIAAQRFDPLGARMMKDLYTPNRAQDNVTGLNNFVATTRNETNYWDLSDRVDWYLTDKWRIFGRPSWYRTSVLTQAPTLVTSELYVQGGSKRNGFALPFSAVWTVSPRTVAEFNMSFGDFIDEYYSPNELGPNGLSKFWPNNPWYTPYSYPSGQFGTYLPGITITGAGNLGQGGTVWTQHPNGSSFSAKVSQQRRFHFLKAGFESRRSSGYALTVNGNQFTFNSNLTADTFLNPNTRLYGDQFATLLLGALNNDSNTVYAPIKHPRTEYYGAFLQDDYKVSRNITLNLGLRWEYETPWHDPLHQLGIGVDLSAPNPAIQANPPQIPASITSLLNVPYNFNGQFSFTSDSHPGVWSSQKLVLMPRVGLALRINDRTALRFGYARYVTPAEMNFVNPPYAGYEALNFIEPPYPGYNSQQSPVALLQGVPQATISNPFPANSPLIAPGGTSLGAATGLGTPNIVWSGQDYSRPVNDRFNLTISRQLPGRVVVEATYFANFGHNLTYTYNLNQVDPKIIYQYKGATSVSVPNPFYNYLTPQQFPGPLRNQPTVTLSTLLAKYPQYGNLYEAFKPGGKEQYESGELKIQRPFAKGFNFLFGYAYTREKTQIFFNDLANYDGHLSWLDSPNPHHRLSIAGTYQLPFGKGRAFLQDTPRVVDALLGGWQVVGAWYFNTGNYLQFGPALVSGDPAIDSPTPGHWFDITKFQVLPAYTSRTNPYLYRDVKGPVYWDMQSTLSKRFPIFERVEGELKIAAYNLTNRLNRADPDVVVTSSTFGQTLRQATTTGRQMEFGLRIVF